PNRFEARPAEGCQERRAVEVVQVAGRVEMEPTTAAEIGLEAAEVGDLDQQPAIGGDQAADLVQGRVGVGEVLEDVEQGDHVEGAGGKPAFDQVPDLDLQAQHLASVLRGCFGRLHADRLPAPGRQLGQHQAPAAA